MKKTSDMPKEGQRMQSKMMSPQCQADKTGDRPMPMGPMMPQEPAPKPKKTK